MIDSKEEALFDRPIWSVSELTGRIKELLESGFGMLWVVGEISNLRRPSSGHYYLTLKDRDSQIRAVMFRTKQRYLGLDLADGQEVLARGRLSVYEPRGEYQLVIDYMEPRGEGALRLAFDQLKIRLAAEGLFDQDRKKKLPYLPGRVAVVTSPTGAAIRDFVLVSRRRYENTRLSIYPVMVQGEGAAGQIAQAVFDLNRWGDFDLIVLTRGGGSLEDLWAFNEEIVARAVAASAIPVVSAVGHEVDFTIADFVADMRAPTPSAAAEMIFREKKELAAYLNGAERRLLAAVRGRLNLTREKLAHFKTRLGEPNRIFTASRQRLDDLVEEIIRLAQSKIRASRQTLTANAMRMAGLNPVNRLNLNRAKLDGLGRELVKEMISQMDHRRNRLSILAGRLGNLSPLSVLKRGFALARVKPELKALRSSREVEVGDRINLLLGEGELDVVVEEVVK